ncbi:MAG TPA: putative entry exclusion protein TrbK-alt [Bradyrhizobium sp.]|jgi:conjugative transfer region protein TrbK|nr:putative entry exclusion protein TrbK-alt [Bradyrhizobium sp.]
MSDVNAFKALSLGTTICLGMIAVAACTIHLRGDEDQPQAAGSVAQDADPAAAELERCRTISYEQKDRLAECRKIWADKRRQFLGSDRGTAVSPERRDPGDPPSASIKDQSRLPSIFFPAPTQSER